MKEAIHTKSNNKLLYIIYSIITILLFSLIIHSTNTHANSIEFSATVEPSLNVTIPTDLVSLNLNPANSAFSSQDLTVSVGTNNTTGYTLTMTAEGTDLTRTEALSGSYPTISTLASEVAESSFTPNRWGYRFSDNTTNTNYQPFTTNLPFNESSEAVNNDSRTITFGAKVDTTQAPGTYELALTFNATAKPALQDLNITMDGGVESIAVKTGSATGTTIATITNPGDSTYTGGASGLVYGTNYYLVPTFASGKELDSWTQTSVGIGGTGLSSTTDETPYFNIGDGINSVTLTSKDSILIQNLDPTLCTTSTSLEVTDSRDGNKYTIQRLADGKCWMTSNLNLAGGTALYSDDSNVADANTKASGNPYYTLPASTAIYSGTSVPSDQFSNDSTAYVFNTGNNTTTCSSSTPCNSYYSWLAATAGGKDSSGNAVSTRGYNAAYSICPKGWRLPTSTTSNASPTTSPNWKTGDWYALATAYGANLESNYYESAGTFYTNAGPGTTPNFLLAGYYYSGSFNNGGSYGYYWSSTSYSSTSAYSLIFSSSSVLSADYYNRRGGFSVRCVLDDSMQTITSSSLASKMPNEGDSTTLTDVRDGKTYQVTKINGSYWMTQNLRYAGDTGSTAAGSSAGSMTIKSTTTNINTDKTLTYYSLYSGDSSYSSHCDSTNGYTYPCAKTGKDNNNGDTVWYNYAAASAGTITGNSNSTVASYDICPKNWHLPTSTEINGFDGTNNGNATYAASTQFAPVYGGYYNNGSLNVASTNGLWWSATAYNTTSRYYLDYYSSKLYSGSSSYIYRGIGSYVRCARSS